MRADKKIENIHIVTALLKNHRTRPPAIAPIASYEGMCLMPIADVFHGVDVYDFSYPARIDNIFNRAVEGSIA